MNYAKLFCAPLVFLAASGLALAQQTDPSNKPSVVVGNNRPRPTKDTKFRTIQGIVEDQANNPVSGAIVQLKDLRSSKVVDFATKDDGKFAFRDLPFDVNFELLARRGPIATPVKKVSVYDSRKQVTINFKLEPPPAKPAK